MRQKRYSLIILAFTFLFLFSGTFLPSHQQSLIPITDSDDIAPHTLSQNGNGFYDWWDTDWKYRTFLEIEASNGPLIDTSIPVTVNFTDALNDIPITGSIDENSIRVIEYNHSTGEVIEELPSHLFKYSSW